jgi:hypothetical protein
VAVPACFGSFSTYGLASYVLSRSLPPGERNGVIFTSDSPKSIVAVLRKRKGKNIWRSGSKLWNWTSFSI